MRSSFKRRLIRKNITFAANLDEATTEVNRQKAKVNTQVRLAVDLVVELTN